MNSLLTWFLIFESHFPNIAAFASLAAKTSGIVILSSFIVSLLSSRSATARCWVWRSSIAGIFLVLLFSLGPSVVGGMRIYVPVAIDEDAVGKFVARGEAMGLFRTPDEISRTIREREADWRSTAIPSRGEQKPSAFPSDGRGRTPWREIDEWVPFVAWGIAVILLLIGSIRMTAGAAWLYGRSREANEGLLGEASRAAVDAGLRASPCIRVAEGINSPLLLGCVRPIVYLPVEAIDWEAARTRAVFLHEFAHWTRKDHFWLYAARIAKMLVWWNPLVASVAQRMSAEAEEAADDAVLLRDCPADVYARDLIEIASRRGSAKMGSVGVFMVGNNPLERRIKALLADNPWRGKIGRIGALTIAVTLAVSLAGASLYVIRDSSAAKQTEKSAAAARKIATVRVVDENGDPVANAWVKGYGMRTKTANGSSYSWSSDESVSDMARTDNQGIARISYPASIQGLAVGELRLAVYHPDFFAKLAEIDPEVEIPTIGIQRGAEVTVKVDLPPGIRLPVYADFKATDFKYHLTQWRRLPDGSALFAHVPESKFAVRAVAFGEGDEVYFSAPMAVDARAGEKVDLTATIKAGDTLSGRLGPTAVRPIRNGRVIALVSTPCADDPSLKCEWGATTEVNPDGSFLLRGLPTGELEIVAICDGFVSRDSGQRQGGSTNAQKFRVGEGEINVPMEETGSARVLVKDRKGRPVSNADVSFWPNQNFQSGSSVLGFRFQSSNLLRLSQDSPEPFTYPSFSAASEEFRKFSAKTGEDGFAIVGNLPQGSLNFQVSATGLEMPIRADRNYPARYGTVEVKAGGEATVDVTMDQEGTGSLEEALKVYDERNKATTLGPATDLRRQTGRELAVSPGETFSGRVVNAAGKPIQGVLVDVWTWCDGNEVVTDSDGEFRLELKGYENVEVRFSKDGLSPTHITNQRVGELTEPVVMNDKTFLTGIVRDARGEPAQGAKIKAICGEKDNSNVVISNVFYETTSGPNGEFKLPVHPDVYEIQARATDGTVARHSGVTVEEGSPLNVVLTVLPGATFRARLRDASTGDPVRGVTLRMAESREISAISDENGNISIPNLMAGNREFYVEPDKTGYSRWWSPQAIPEWERFKIERDGWQRNFDDLSFEIANDMKPVEIALEKGVIIRGVVVDPAGKPVSGATVDPSHSGTGNSLTGDTRFSARTRADGTFELLLPASGKAEYNLTAHDGKYEEWRNWANVQAPRIKTSPGGIIDKAKLVLARPFTLRGRVIDESGRPVPEREVRAVPASLDGNRYYDPTTKTKADGTFELKFVGEGRQYVQVAPFWLDPREAPQNSSKIVEVGSDVPPLDFKIDREQR